MASARWIWDVSLDPGPLTRKEFVNRARTQGLDVTERKIAYWEKRGILPHPLRRWHNGATRALYPDWGVGVLREFIAAKDQGMGAAELQRVVLFSIVNATGNVVRKCPHCAGTGIILETNPNDLHSLGL